MQRASLVVLASLVTACVGPPPECVPACRSTYTCVSGECVSLCNPVCAEGEVCTSEAECVPRPIDAGAADASRPDAEAPREDGGQDASGADGGPLDAGADAPSHVPCVDDEDADGIPDSAEGYYDGPRDQDGDSIPDYLDLDSDGDTILDALEWGEGGGCDPSAHDRDGDGVPDPQDEDSDGDGAPDRCEARGSASPSPSELELPVLDTDGDGSPDFLDRDSDADTLADGLEDLDGDCTIDPGETDARSADTDADGEGDLVETALLDAAAASDPARGPARSGFTYFVAPFSSDGSAPVTPASLWMAGNVQPRVDVAFLIDLTTGMAGTLSALRSSMSVTILPALRGWFPDSQYAVGSFQDFPSPLVPSDVILGPVQPLTSATATLQIAINGLSAAGGGDVADGANPALYGMLTGSALTSPGGSVGPFTAASGRWGALSFRPDAFLFVVPITSSPMHNGKRATSASTYDASFVHPYSFSTYGADQAIARLNEASAGIVAAVVDDGARATALTAPYGFLAYWADRTSSYVPPSAFSSRSCGTGLMGAAVPADGPMVGGVSQCRLVMSVGSTGTGLSSAILDGIGAARTAFEVAIHAVASEAPGPVSILPLVDRIEPVPTGGFDPLTGVVCVPFPASTVADLFNTARALPGAGDIAETITRVHALGTDPRCFEVALSPNTSVTSAALPQVHPFDVDFVAQRSSGGTFALGRRTVHVVIPPDPEL